MGGWGSGRWERIAAKDVTDRQNSLDVRYLHRMGCLKLGAAGSLKWSLAGTVVGSISYFMITDKIIFHYLFRRGEEWEPVIQEVTLTWTPCNYGGWRPWFLCQCGRRVALLYSGAKYFLCRHCHSLSYASRNESKDKRTLRRIIKIYEKMGPWRFLGSVPAKKPKGMHTNTFNFLKTKYMITALKYVSDLEDKKRLLHLYLNYQVTCA